MLTDRIITEIHEAITAEHITEEDGNICIRELQAIRKCYREEWFGQTMQHYPAPFDEARTRRWIEWNLENYAQYGFGLWAVVLKENGEFIGDCGITIQNIDGKLLPEIGYHINKKYWRRGFAKEAAKAVRDWAFENTDYPSLYSYCKYTNEASYKTAEAIGMHFEKEYHDDTDKITHVSVIHRTAKEQ